MPKEKYLTGKIFTQRIERNNLTLRTRIKRLVSKTICFSRSVEIHEKSSVPSIRKAHVLLIGSTTQRSTYHHKYKNHKMEVRVFTDCLEMQSVLALQLNLGGYLMIA